MMVTDGLTMVDNQLFNAMKLSRKAAHRFMRNDYHRGMYKLA